MKLDYFKTADFHSALRMFFQNLHIPQILSELAISRSETKAVNSFADADKADLFISDEKIREHDAGVDD